MIHDNTKHFRIDDKGKIVAVRLIIEDVPNQIYEVKTLRLIDEYESNGRTIAYCSTSDYREDIFLGWPYRQGYKSLATTAISNDNGEIPIINKFWNNDYGWLAVHVGRLPESQIVGGLGLPLGHHVSFEIKWEKRDYYEPEEPTNPTYKIKIPKHITEFWVEIEK